MADPRLVEKIDIDPTRAKIEDCSGCIDYDNCQDQGYCLFPPIKP